MNEVIRKLYEIETEASQVMEDAKRQKQEMKARQYQEQEDIARALEAEMEGRLTILNSTLEEKASQEMNEVIKKNQEHIRQLEEKYEGRYQELAARIVKKITEV